VIGAWGPLSGHAYFLHWGVVQISLTNFVIVVLMLVIFALALIVPFPHGGGDSHEKGRDEPR
jgi:hypothetical protein